MRLLQSITLLTTVTLLLFIANRPASATIVGGTVTGGTAQAGGGTWVTLTVPLTNPFGPPNSVGSDNFESLNMFGFDKSQNILLLSPLTVDVGSTIPAGTTVASHYIFFDPELLESITGTIDFDATVLGILTSQTTLDNSDFLANTGVNYLSSTLRGLEPEDSVSISGPNQIFFNAVAGSPGDYIRVLTERSILFDLASVPEPSSFLLLGLGMVGMAVKARRRRAR